MDFLDPKKSYRHKITLYIGYLLIAVAITIGTIILLYEAYGFGIGQNGQIIQNGLIFLSSQPNPANIYVNGKFKTQTNTSLKLVSGIYNFSIGLNGYRTWHRQIEIDGGTIVYFDYPLLIPNVLKTTEFKTYTSAPNLASESLNRQYLLVMPPGSTNSFDLYNLNNPTQQPTSFSLPSSLVSPANSSNSWKVISWANDNQHILVTHTYDGKTEYILINTANPSSSVNLSQTFSSLSYTSLAFINKTYDQYYLYNATDQSLASVSLENPTAETKVLSNVISFNSYLNNTILYATSKNALPGKVNIDELTNGTNYHIKTFPAGSTYLLNMASYNGVIYVAAGDQSANKVYIYKDPVNQIITDPKQVPVPSQVLFVKNPNYLNFSTTAQYIMAENGNQFGVYDIENQHGYNYTTSLPLDAPQAHATWMDGNRISYISNNKLVIFDYDHNYQQTLVNASPLFPSFFDPNYHYVFTIKSSTNGSYQLTRTSLLAS